MAGIGPKLPLVVDSNDGAYKLVKTYQDEVKQNLKNLVLTCPGERIMIPDFGVGIRNYLFEINEPGVLQTVASKIRQQVSRFMPFLEINDVIVESQELDPAIQNAVSVGIYYTILPLDLEDTLGITDFLEPATI